MKINVSPKYTKIAKTCGMTTAQLVEKALKHFEVSALPYYKKLHVLHLNAKETRLREYRKNYRKRKCKQSG